MRVRTLQQRYQKMPTYPCQSTSRARTRARDLRVANEIRKQHPIHGSHTNPRAARARSAPSARDRASRASRTRARTLFTSPTRSYPPAQLRMDSMSMMKEICARHSDVTSRRAPRSRARRRARILRARTRRTCTARLRSCDAPLRASRRESRRHRRRRC